MRLVMRALLLLLIALPIPAVAGTIKAEGKLLSFEYSWPAAASAVPRLDARMRIEAAKLRKQAMGNASDDAKERGSDTPFHQHSFLKTWSVAGRTTGLLSLEAETYSFTGGAHGNTGYEALLWDRKRARPVPFAALFRDPALAMRRLTRAFCPALDAQREEKRGEPVDKTDMFGGCPKLADQALSPARVRGGRFTAVRVVIGPYEAGPYSEGSYELELRLDPTLIAPAWRGAFGR